MTRVKVSPKGQIVIPSELRAKYKIQAGTELEVRESAGRLYLFPVLTDPVEQARGILKGGRSLTEAFLAGKVEAIKGEEQALVRRQTAGGLRVDGPEGSEGTENG
ncbi:MAG: AbrB/MazE/SpoVT family DNA-binding domain-containing protein [Firmicutes bacterium]|nr:AbrB/MazE/SpoVT family DNA-binding domain-containing protein [Bacillota bacterium]